MKITPIEIRQHTFEKALRGYRVDEVDAFLASLSQEWERVVGESKMLKMQLELAEKELNKLKEIELTLFRTLKNAEDNSSQIAEQANRQAEQYMAEVRLKADEQLAVAKKKSAVMIQDAENQSRYVRETLSVELKSLEQDFKAMERYKDNLMVQIRALATNAMESVDRFEKKFAKQQARQRFDEPAEEQPADAPAETAVAPPASAAGFRQPDAEQPVSADAPEGTPDSHLPADAEMPAELSTASTGAEADAAAPHVPEPVQAVSSEAPVPEPAKRKSGGSFFDQI